MGIGAKLRALDDRVLGPAPYTPLSGRLTGAGMMLAYFGSKHLPDPGWELLVAVVVTAAGVALLGYATRDLLRGRLARMTFARSSLVFAWAAVAVAPPAFEAASRRLPYLLVHLALLGVAGWVGVRSRSLPDRPVAARS